MRDLTFDRNNSLMLRLKLLQLGAPLLGGRRWYQYIDFGNGVTTRLMAGPRAVKRTESFLKLIANKSLFSSEDRVLDIGSNAGLFSLEMAQSCADVVGVEIDLGFYSQAVFLKETYRQRGKRVDNVRFIHGDLLDHLSVIKDRTIIVASKVLYHPKLGDTVQAIMEATRDSTVHTILIQGHTNQGQLGGHDGVRELIAKYGFELSAVDHDDEYPIAVARKTRR
jgi:SAM-dependent methyltransferase